MRAMMITSFVQALLLVLDGPMIKKGLDALLDAVEDAVTNSETKLDDAIVLALTAKIRQELDIPDND